MAAKMERTAVSEKIIVALDTSSLEDAERLLKSLKGIFSFYKIGLQLFTSHGWSAVDLVQRFGGRVFLDLKLHDIPNTVTKTIREICNHDIAMTNVHALGGLEMMRKVAEEVNRGTHRQSVKPRLLGVTVLTSHSNSSPAILTSKGVLTLEKKGILFCIKSSSPLFCNPIALSIPP